MRRFVCAILIICLIANLVPAPAAAMSTQQEISLGKQLNEEVDSQSVIITDPFLTNWVDQIGAKLAGHRARTDITYHFEIIDSNEINSFALPGGYIHVDMGLLNFASSDDQVASVMGHEMGHVERRHVVTLQNKANILSILIGVLSILNPIGYLLGGTAGDLAYLKFSRQDELQADQYGLLLMSEAGYDPRSNVDVFAQLAKLEGESGNSDKYFRDHPAPNDRIAHLVGYPELSAATPADVTAAAIHDESEGRFSYAKSRLEDALAKDPEDSLAASHVTSVRVATSESAPNAGGGARGQSASAYDTDASAEPDAASRLAAANNVVHDNLAAAAERAKAGSGEVETFVGQLQGLSNATPNLGHPKKKGNNLSIAIDGLDKLTRDVNGTIDTTSDVMSTAPGLIDDVRSSLKAMSDPLSDGPLTPKYQALLPSYPSMTAGLSQSSDDLVESIDRARAAVSLSEDSVRLAGDFLSALNRLDTTSGDISAKDMPRVQTAMNSALSAWYAAEALAMKASNQMYAAQTRSLSVQLTLLDLESSPQRYEAYRRALVFRFPGVEIPDYRTMLALGVTPGELGCAAWYAFDTKKPLAEVLAKERATSESCVDLAIHDGLFAESMEIAEGLLLEDYTETPSALK